MEQNTKNPIQSITIVDPDVVRIVVAEQRSRNMRSAAAVAGKIITEWNASGPKHSPADADARAA